MDPSLQPEPRPETPAAGNALLWMTGSIFAFGVFVMAVPGRDPAGRTWFWIGFVLIMVGGATAGLALRARLRYLREHRAD